MAPTLSDLRLEAQDGGLLVTWSVSGGPAAAAVGAGPTPVAPDHVPLANVPAGTTEVMLEGAGRDGRRYVSVALEGGRDVVVAGERRLAFEGPTNFRDLGGYPVAGGGRTRWGRVYRSDALHRFTQADLGAFRRLGTRCVYDLRGDAERSASPDPVESVHIALLDWYTGSEAKDLFRVRTARDAESILRDMYVGMLDNAAPALGELLSRLGDEDLLPAVLHCAGGKDRTGLSAAVLLDVLGVDRVTVLDDYELTGRFRTADHEPLLMRLLSSAGLPDEAARAFLGSPRWAMSEALEHLERSYGGAEPYLLGPAGMAPDRLAALGELLVVKA
jgi:protein-tyrosine phosphatase